MAHTITIRCELESGEKWTLTHEFDSPEKARRAFARIATGGRVEKLPENLPNGSWELGANGWTPEPPCE